MIILEGLIVSLNDPQIQETIQQGFKSLVGQISKDEPVIQRHTLWVLKSICKYHEELLMD